MNSNKMKYKYEKCAYMIFLLYYMFVTGSI